MQASMFYVYFSLQRQFVNIDSHTSGIQTSCGIFSFCGSQLSNKFKWLKSWSSKAKWLRNWQANQRFWVLLLSRTTFFIDVSYYFTKTTFKVLKCIKSCWSCHYSVFYYHNYCHSLNQSSLVCIWRYSQLMVCECRISVLFLGKSECFMGVWCDPIALKYNINLLLCGCCSVHVLHLSLLKTGAYDKWGRWDWNRNSGAKVPYHQTLDAILSFKGILQISYRGCSQNFQNLTFLHLFVALLLKHISPKKLSRNHFGVK